MGGAATAEIVQALSHNSALTELKCGVQARAAMLRFIIARPAQSRVKRDGRRGRGRPGQRACSPPCRAKRQVRERRSISQHARPASTGPWVRSISSNVMGEAGAEALARGLSTNTVLHTLRCTLQMAFRRSRALLTALLSMDNNKELGDQGASALATALQANSTLAVLECAPRLPRGGRAHHPALSRRLCDSSIGEAGATSLAGALRVNASLTALRHASVASAGGLVLTPACAPPHRQAQRQPAARRGCRGDVRGTRRECGTGGAQVRPATGGGGPCLTSCVVGQHGLL